MIVHIIEAKVSGPQLLELAFDEGVRKTVNIGPLLNGPIFEPLRDPTYFAQVRLDPVCRTVVWPNGADIAPETLHGLPISEPLSAGSADER